MTRESDGFLAMVWKRKWLLATCVLLSVAATSVVLAFYPARYHSQAVILLVPKRIPDEYVRTAGPDDFTQRLHTIQQQIFSRTRLERIINEYDLYHDARPHMPIESLIEQMRRDVSVEMTGANSVRVGFDGDDPRVVWRVTEQLASLFINQNLEDRSRLADNTNVFVESQLEETRQRLTMQEEALAAAARAGHSPTRAQTIEYEVVQQEFRDLLAKRNAARMAADLDMRQIGEQFRIVDVARIPTEPIGPNRIAASTGAAFAGLGLGALLIGVTSRRRLRVDEEPSNGN